MTKSASPTSPLVLGAMMFGTAIDEPTSFALLEEHAAAVEAAIADLRSQQDKLTEKLDWYRGRVSPATVAAPSAL